MDKNQRLSGTAASRIWLASLLLGVLVLLASPSTVWAQVAASISGKVEDATGAAVSGATVTDKDMETGATRVVKTDETGNYRLLSLPVGVHELHVEKTGFKAEVWTVKLDIGEDAVMNLNLSVGEAVQEVTVSGNLPVVNTTTTSVSGLVGEKEIKDLPLNGRSFDDLITLNPGTINYSNMVISHTTTSNGSVFSVDGQKPSDNETLLNGVEDGGASQLAVTPGGVSGYLLGVDAVREFNVLTGTYGAEYGKRSGAQVIVATQSGSNEVHGSVYEFLRNNVLDTRSYFDPASGPPPFKQNQFGVSLGGPIKKDKIFLFGNYEGFRQRLSATQITNVPDKCVYQYGAVSNANGVCPVIVPPNPSSLMQQYAQTYWPHSANDVELGNGTAKNISNPLTSINEDFGTARLDYLLGERDTLSGSYTIDDGTSLLPQPDPYFASALSVGSQVFSLQETHIFSPRVVNTATFGFSRAAFADNSAPSAAFLNQPLPPGLSSLQSLQFVPGLGWGGITVGGGNTTTGAGVVSGAGPSNNAGVWNRRNLFTYEDNLQISKGIHQISMGVWFQRLQDNEDTASRQLGVAAFANLQSFLTGSIAAPSGSFQIVTNPAELGWRTLMGAWYVQDAMRVRHNLTVQVGLRHEFDTGWNEAHGRAANFWTDANGILEPTAHVGNSAFSQNNAKWLFGPRVALAWDPYGDGSTAVHAGFGIYYSMLDSLAFQLNSVPGPNYENGTFSYTGSLPTIVQGLSQTPANPTFAPYGVQKDAKTPTVEKWSLSIDQKLTNTILLSVGYLGSFGYHQVVAEDDNSIQPLICVTATCQAGGDLKASATVPNTVPEGTLYIPWGNGVPNTRPQPKLTNGFFWNTVGKSSYNALHVDVTKRFSQRLLFRANYTWSKSLDNNSAPTLAQSTNEPQMVLDRFNLRKDWGPSALNAAHVAHFTATYQLPFGRGQHWLADAHGVEDKLVSGWTLNTITTLMSGFPLTPQVGSNVSGDGDVRNPDRPTLNLTGPIMVRNGTQWFNPAAFQAPPTGTYGTAAEPIVSRGSLTGPGYVSMDVSMLKNTPITERVKLQFRAECFNVLNHTNFGVPQMLLSSASAGQITTINGTLGREFQFGLKVIY